MSQIIKESQKQVSEEDQAAGEDNTNDKELVIKNPQVSKVNMMGQETFQISGEVEERELSTTPDISQEDVKTVMEQAHVSEQEARKAIEDANGDLAEAIITLQKSE